MNDTPDNDNADNDTDRTLEEIKRENATFAATSAAWHAARDEREARWERDVADLLESWDSDLADFNASFDATLDTMRTAISEIERYVECGTADFSEATDGELAELDASFDASMADMKTAIAEIERYVEGRTPAEVSDAAPLKLEDALCLPELGGDWTDDPQYRRPSPTYTVRKLRQEIERGGLQAQKRGKNLFVTRQAIKEFVVWQDPENPPASISAKPASSAARPGLRSGSSSTEGSKSALAAARLMLKRQRGS